VPDRFEGVDGMNSMTRHYPVDGEIIIIDDNPYDVELTMRALKKHKLGDHVIWLKDGVEALDFFNNHFFNLSGKSKIKPALVLLDLKLPKVNGQEVLEKIKKESQTRGIPIVMLSSSREHADIENAYRAGVNSYIVKPMDFDTFSEWIRQIGWYWLYVNQSPIR
jgi:two-component system response regulator